MHTHDWSVNWESLPAPKSHIGRMALKMTNVIFGIKIQALDFNVSVDQVSPKIKKGSLRKDGRKEKGEREN